MLFLPAGGFSYTGGWLFIGLLFVPMLILGIVLLIKAPDLLEKRLGAKEKEKMQKDVVALSGLLFIVGFVIAGLDRRFGWSEVPLWVVIIASVILLVSYALYAEVMRENAYLSRTIEVQNGQKVIDTGFTAFVALRKIMAALGLCVSSIALRIGLGGWFTTQIFFGVLTALASVGAIVLSLIGKKSEKQQKIARILAAAALIVGFVNAIL